MSGGWAHGFATGTYGVPSSDHWRRPAPAGGTHVIARGDTLWDIAKAAYGDGTLWRRIAEANGNPRPRALHVGTELSIPTK